MSAATADVPLADLYPVLRVWLQRLRYSPPEHRCFVIVESLLTGKFVQYCTECEASKAQPLLLDVPLLGVQHPCATADEAATAGLKVLATLGLQPTEPVRVTFDVTRQETGEEGDPSEWQWVPLDEPDDAA